MLTITRSIVPSAKQLVAAPSRPVSPASSTHVSSSGVVHGGAGGSFDGGAVGSFVRKPSFLEGIFDHASDAIDYVVDRWNSRSHPFSFDLNEVLPGSNGSASSARSFAVGASSASRGASSASRGASSASRGVSSASRGVFVPSPNAASLSYLNADLAKAYGMDRASAYQEALSNTAYQRAVKDMQAAGLNPAVLFGAGRAQTADGVNYISSGDQGYYTSSRGGSVRSSDHAISNSTYGAISSAAGVAAALLTKRPDGFWIGSTVAKGIMGVIDSLLK